MLRKVFLSNIVLSLLSARESNILELLKIKEIKTIKLKSIIKSFLVKNTLIFKDFSQMWYFVFCLIYDPVLFILVIRALEVDVFLKIQILLT